MEISTHGLTKALRLRDLVPMQVVLIVWLGWAGFAAKQGSSQIVLWLLAIVLFYLPLAAVVMKLSRAIPAEGGVYQWVKAGFSPFAGYMAAWNFTIYSITAFAVVGSLLAEGFGRALGSSGAWMLTNRPLTFGITAAACLAAYFCNVRGLRLAKWWTNVGMVLTIGAFAALLYVLAKAFVVGAPHLQASFSFAWPTLSVATLAVFAKIAIGALSGVEDSAIFAEECRKPENDVARSVMIAAPLVALMYISSTSAVLAYVAPAGVDVSAAVPQALRAGFGVSLTGKVLAIAGACAFNFAFAAAMVIYVGMVSRLPMVAGWDGLLPRWWSELHPQYRTPSKAIGAVTTSIFVLGALSLLGADNQEAVQVGTSAGVASLCISYLLLFGVALFGFRSREWRPGSGMRIAAACALAAVLTSLVFQFVPVGEVASRAVYALKIFVVFGAANAAGAFLYWRGTKRVESTLAAAESPSE